MFTFKWPKNEIHVNKNTALTKNKHKKPRRTQVRLDRRNSAREKKKKRINFTFKAIKKKKKS